MEPFIAKTAELNRLLGTAYTAGETVMWTGGLEAYTKLTVDGDTIEHWQKVCNAVIDKAKTENRRVQLVKAVSNNVSTNLTFSKLKAIGQSVLQNQDIRQYQLPEEGEYKLLDGEMVLDVDLAASRGYLQKKLYQ